MDALFWASKFRVPFTHIIKLGRARMKEESHLHLGWLEGD